MIDFPAFRAALEGVDLDQLAEDSGVAVETIRAVAAGDLPPSPGVMVRLSWELGRVSPFELFAHTPARERRLPKKASQRWASDPQSLVIVSRATR